MEPSAYNVMVLSDFLKVTPEYLLGVEEELSVSVETDNGFKGLKLKKIENFSSGKAKNVFQNFRIPVDKPSDFFIQNETEALSPILKKGDILFFTLEGQVINDDIVMIRRVGELHKELRLVKMEGEEIYLIPTNSGYEHYYLTKSSFSERFELLGRLVGFWRVLFNFGTRENIV